MANVNLKHKNEHFESLMRRFKKSVEKDNIIKEIKDREYYEKPSAVKKRKKAAARKRHLRNLNE